ncbi:hypothetical protein QLX08_008320 [Tetragonisca angustula]|uniref:Uncharacterized protein n=1 Tax=Tetragonisca angustula TaxID=166442 RepID=A0AAW0ZNL0_9HYME
MARRRGGRPCGHVRRSYSPMESVEIITQHGRAEMLAGIVPQSYSNGVPPRSCRNARPPENECTCSRDATSDGSEEFHTREVTFVPYGNHEGATSQ